MKKIKSLLLIIIIVIACGIFTFYFLKTQRHNNGFIKVSGKYVLFNLPSE